MSMAGRIKGLPEPAIFEQMHNHPATGRTFKETQVPRDGNHFCRTLAYPNPLNLLTPGGATARLREVGITRDVMDEASSAQTIDSPVPP